MKILLPGSQWGDLTERLRSNLPDCDIVHCPPEKILEHLEGVGTIIPTMTRITGEIMAAATRLKLIQQAGVGLEGVDVAAATERGIYVANVPSGESGSDQSVAELAILHMLLLSRRFREAGRNLESGVWGQPLGATLRGKNVGIIGVGNIGSALAALLKPFGVRLLGLDPRASDDLKQRHGLDWLDGADLEYLLEHSDYVVICASHAPDMIGYEELRRMKRSAFLINVARGNIVKRDALEKALIKGDIAGAGLDVFWKEPVDPSDPIFRHSVYTTPHLGAVTDAGFSGTAARVAENVRRIMAGEAPLNCVNAGMIRGGPSGDAPPVS